MTRRAMLATGVVFMTAPLSSAADFTAKIGHLESDKQSRHVHLVKVGELVKERTNGAVEFQIFPSGQLGNQRQMTEGVQLGTLEATVSPAAFIGGFNPAVSILDIPFLLPADADTAQKLREGEFGKALLDSFATKGVVGVALWPNGMKNFTSNKPLDNLDSFGGQKFRVMDSKILIEQFNALGASAIALPFGELYTSLQTGVVDGQENPLDTIQRMKFHEVQQHLVISEHGAMEDVALFNPVWWNSLPEEYRTIITDAFAEVVPELRAHKAKAVEAALEAIKQGDISVRVASDEEKAALRDKMYDKAKAAYIERAGDSGKDLIGIYEKSYSALQ
ncbi:MAG: TRAP transporter substrate-binding protein [Alphaproteobacteria bacterium]|nr:TRAP transporter substrate-binding protein [Alphaproteobacteria bacterium]